MGRSTDAKCKKCRREQEKLFLKGDRCNTQKCAMIKRNYAPGQHGQTSGARMSEYGVQLREKQKAKKIYGLREEQFYNYITKAMGQKGVTGEVFLRALEKRLDSVVYRLGLAKSRSAARQLVRHGHIAVDGHKVDIPSYQVSVGEVIAVKDNSRERKYFQAMKKKIDTKTLPGWLELNVKEMKAKVGHEPAYEELEQSIKTQLIIEYYSR